MQKKSGASLKKNRMLRLTLSTLLSASIGASVSVCFSSTAHAGDNKQWITLGDKAYNELKLITSNIVVSDSRVFNSGTVGFASQERVHLVKIDESILPKLSAAVHNKLKRCGGFIAHSNEVVGRQSLITGVAPPPAGIASLAPSYVIDNQTTVTPMLSQMQATNIGQTIVDLSAFVNRYYTTAGGVSGSNWIRDKWTQMASGKANVTVEQYTHAGFPQKSVILTMKGSDNASEVVILGGHLDSINTAGTTETTKAPGADDDASGIASLTEAIRVMLAANYQPRRTIKFIAYAAEEVGLKGSADIARKFKSDGVNVVGVMQLDMTNYKGSAKDIYIYTDYTNAAQNTFVTNLITTYQPSLTVGTDTCGYGCSDHASWHAQGYATSMPFETSMSQSNPKIHGTGDTYANMGSQANHALKFARLGASFAVELGSDGAGQTPTPTTTPLTKDTAVVVSSAAGTQKMYSFIVPSNVTNLTFKTSGGTGNLDIYTQLNTQPSTTSYLQKSESSSNTETITIAAPAAGTYYLLAKSYSAVSGASLVASYQTGGSTGGNVLTSGASVSVGSLATNATKTYTIVVPSGKSSVTFKLSGGTGDGDMYAKLGSAPTTSVFDKKSEGSTNAETVTFSAPQAGTYYVMIKAYSAVNGASILATVQ